MLLEVRHLKKVFGGLVAVNDVSLSVGKGEIVYLIGPNGAGKTTLFNCISGFMRPSSGAVVFDGQDITGRRDYEVCRLGLARTFQVMRPFAKLTLLENVTAAATLRQPSIIAAEKRAKEVLQTIGIESYAEHPAGALPIGLRKKLELARALATEPKILLLDEVMGGLIPSEVDEMIELLRKLSRQGLTIFAVDHVMRAVMKLAHRIVVMDHGEKIAEGSPDEVANHKAVIRAYLGEGFHLA